MILIIDNYDSFVYNLARYCGLLGHDRKVVRNDAITCDKIAELAPEAIIVSPGPCSPDEAGISCRAVRDFAHNTPTLGVCLGHQCIANVFGGRTYKSGTPVHGRTSYIHHIGHALFAGMDQPFAAARYHSLISEPGDNGPLQITARSDTNEVMGLAHQDFPVYGVQFHPESVLTDNGMRIMHNFMELAAKWHDTTQHRSA